MSNNPEPKNDPTDDPKPDPDPKPAKDGTDWKAEARKWEQRAKENSDAAARLKELEDADKTELDKAAEKLSAAEQRATEAESRALRLEVAQAKGLNPAQAKWLPASTSKDDLEAAADELLETFAPADPASNGAPAGKPTEALQPGSGDPTVEPEPDMRAVVDDIPRGL